MATLNKGARELRYAELTRKLNKLQIIAASIITLLTLVATWGRWDDFTVIAATQAALIPFNAVVTMVLLRRWGAERSEILRAIVNVGAAVASGHFTGWPFPIWLWLPYVAVAFDQFSPRISWSTLFALTTFVCAFSLLDGMPWIYALSFTFLAVFFAATSTVKLEIIRDMVLQADEQQERLKEEIRMRKAVEVELRQAQKLEAVGRLASGIAHEINTPVQFVGDSVSFVQSGFIDLLRLIDRYRAVVPLEAAAAIAQAEAELDLEYLRENLPQACDRASEGLRRIATIVRSMKKFAHPDQTQMVPADLNDAIATTLIIARSEYKDIADVETDLGAIPPVMCRVGEINQVILNLLVNAAHAIQDKRQKELGKITVRTRATENHVDIDIQDTGKGIPDAIRDHIYDPFFTTKEIGRGTGQGLAIAHTVVQKHGGALSFESKLDVGTTFSIRLPIAQRAGEEAR